MLGAAYVDFAQKLYNGIKGEAINKINVLQLSWDDMYATYGGIQTQVVTLLNRNVDGCGRTLARVLPTLHAAQIRTHSTFCHFGLGSLTSDLDRLVKEESIQVVHTHNFHRPEGIGIAEPLQIAIRTLGLRHVSTIHDVIDPNSRNELDRQKELLRYATCVATSPFNARSLRQMFGIDSAIIPPCLPAIEGPAIVRSKRIPTIAAPGRLTRRKGLMESLIVSGYVSREIGPLNLLLSSRQHEHNGGEATFVTELERVAGCFSDLTLLFFEGRQAFPGLYERADVVLCLPAFQEGFGLIPLESIAAGTPAVVTPNGGMEWVAEYPKSILVLERDYVQIAATVLRILKERNNAMSGLLQDGILAREKYAAEQMLAAYEELYRQPFGDH